jgi:hypothetical protein
MNDDVSITPAPRPGGLRLTFEDHFDGPTLNPDVWVPHYLPAWSSRTASAATYDIRDSCLHLSIPPEHGFWLADEHTPLLRVSGIQSGNFSGPVGSTIGQQPWRDGAIVREEQETFWGWTPDHGYLEMRARIGHAALDGRVVDGRARGHPRSVCGNLRVRGVRRRHRARYVDRRRHGPPSVSQSDAVPELIVDYLRGYDP